MGTGRATRRIHSGDLLHVDGDSGAITVLEDDADADAAATEPRSTSESSGPLLDARRAALVAAAMVGLVAWWRRRQ
jgi:hypothetical protein